MNDERACEEQQTCPVCGSQSLFRDGLRYLSSGITVQRWLCRRCSYRFSLEGSSSKEMDTSLNIVASTVSDRRVCELLAEESKNLAETNSPLESGQAGATKLQEPRLKGKIVQFLCWMQKQGYKNSTIVSKDSMLRRLLALGTNLLDPENAKEIIATQDNWSESRNETVVYAYDLFAKWSGIKWSKPIYDAPRTLPFIPRENEIDDLIAGCNKQIATFLQLGKETGARAGELYNIQWKNMDLENRTVNITPEKGSNPRALRISNKLVGMLNGFNKEDARIFTHYKDLSSLRRCFERYRKRAANKFGNPRILQITFRTLRHWKATTEYHKTKDILHVMQILGHKNIKNTLLYTQLLEYENNDDFICKVAKKPNEIQELIENGFEYICDQEDLKYFRKRK